jgi:hypothetical protein
MQEKKLEKNLDFSPNTNNQKKSKKNIEMY